MEYNKHVLVVDDEENVRFSLQLLLEEIGCNVSTASGGLKALNTICQRRDIDLLITDLHMGEFSGYDLLNDIKVLFPELPFIVISGSSVADVNKLLALGNCISYIEKPFRGEHIKSVVSRYFGAGQMNDLLGI